MFSMSGRWNAPTEKGQVVYHHKTWRFGLVTKPMDGGDARGQKVEIFFPDKMRIENRWSNAVVESGHVVPAGAVVNGLGEGCQGLYWLDSKDKMWCGTLWQADSAAQSPRCYP